MSDPATVDYCTSCSLWHVGAPCDHDPEAPCLHGCGGPRGFRWLDNKRQEVKPRTRCVRCWQAAGMPGVEGEEDAADSDQSDEAGAEGAANTAPRPDQN